MSNTIFLLTDYRNYFYLSLFKDKEGSMDIEVVKKFAGSGGEYSIIIAPPSEHRILLTSNPFSAIM
jgi:hypothetical protein